jgi:hypothetical protein
MLGGASGASASAHIWGGGDDVHGAGAAGSGHVLGLPTHLDREPALGLDGLLGAADHVHGVEGQQGRAVRVGI